MTTIHEWAIMWGIPAIAVNDLQQRLGLLTPSLAQLDPLRYAAQIYPEQAKKGQSEAWASSVVRLEASRKGVRLFRNNVGALIPKGDSRPVRYGLCNESKAVNEVIKSADLIGLRPVAITPAMVGHTVGQFVSREVKEPGWQYTGTGREVAQLAWLNLVTSLGGDAAFATGEGSL